MKQALKQSTLIIAGIVTFAACKKDSDPVIVVAPSSGSTMTLNGGTGGSSAANSVYVDFSANKQDSVKRNGWDLGFYTGSDYKVKINNTTVAYIKATTKTDINVIGSADTVGAKLAFNQSEPSAADFTLMDNLDGSVSGISITASATESDNKVYILNRGTGGGITWSNSQYFKLRVLRSNNGYTLQYAPLTATTYSTLSISKNGEGDFVHVSLTNGSLVSTLPVKKDWDIEWTYAAYKTAFGASEVMYPFSDLVFLNTIAGVTAVERTYTSADLATTAYANFNKDSVAKYSFASNRDVIGKNWRNTAAPGSTIAAGTIKTKFYVVKDATGNLYKLRFLSFTTEDGGTRGKPQIEYTLIK